MAATKSTGEWYKHAKNIHGVLLDISGVLYNDGEGGGAAIEGSIDAVKRLKASGTPVRFCTNETTTTVDKIVSKLGKMGFDMKTSEVFAPIPAVRKVLQQRALRPHLLVHQECLPDFASVDQSEPNCVVIGDAQQSFSYTNLNAAFRVLMGLDKPILISLGRGKYYKLTDGLNLDAGPYMKALEYACDVKAEIVGKPSESFFLTAVNDMGIKPENTMMIGDDIVNDVGGAQACGLRGVQVRTGKYRAKDEPHPTVTPDGYVNNLAQAIDLYLQNK